MSILMILAIIAFLLWNFQFSAKAKNRAKVRRALEDRERTLAAFRARTAAENAEWEKLKAEKALAEREKALAERAEIYGRTIGAQKRVEKEVEERVEKEVFAKYTNDLSLSLSYGHVNSMLICPHCQTKGGVRNKKVETDIVTRKNVGLGGFALGGKDVTKTMANTFRCDNCGTSWEV